MSSLLILNIAKFLFAATVVVLALQIIVELVELVSNYFTGRNEALEVFYNPKTDRLLLKSKKEGNINAALVRIGSL